MTEPGPEHAAPGHRAELVSDAMEILALVLLCAAGFAAPTDWNITLGLALVAVAIAVVSFALSPAEEADA